MIKNKKLEGVLLDIWGKNKLGFQADPGVDDKIISDAMVAYENSSKQYLTPLRSYFRKRMLSLMLLKWASIPIILTALILILNPFEGSSVAWGKIPERISQAQTYIVRIKHFWRLNGVDFNPFKSESIGYASKEYGYRYDTIMDGKTIGRGFISPDRKVHTKINLKTGKIEQEAIEPSLGSENTLGDPTRDIKYFLSQPYTKIGKETINGIETEGIEIPADWTVDDNFKGTTEKQCRRLWADIETGFPIRLEVRGNPHDPKLVFIADFQWNVPLPQSLFQIPELKKVSEKKKE